MEDDVPLTQPDGQAEESVQEGWGYVVESYRNCKSPAKRVIDCTGDEEEEQPKPQRKTNKSKLRRMCHSLVEKDIGSPPPCPVRQMGLTPLEVADIQKMLEEEPKKWRRTVMQQTLDDCIKFNQVANIENLESTIQVVGILIAAKKKKLKAAQAN